MTNTTTQSWIDGTVTAEDAPIGVQLWPTTNPRYGLNFTIQRVEIVRNSHGTHVCWVYENGAERIFDMGEKVAVRTEAPL